MDTLLDVVDVNGCPKGCRPLGQGWSPRGSDGDRCLSIFRYRRRPFRSCDTGKMTASGNCQPAPLPTGTALSGGRIDRHRRSMPNSSTGPSPITGSAPAQGDPRYQPVGGHQRGASGCRALNQAKTSSFSKTASTTRTSCRPSGRPSATPPKGLNWPGGLSRTVSPEPEEATGTQDRCGRRHAAR